MCTQGAQKNGFDLRAQKSLKWCYLCTFCVHLLLQSQTLPGRSTVPYLGSNVFQCQPKRIKTHLHREFWNLVVFSSKTPKNCTCIFAEGISNFKILALSEFSCVLTKSKYDRGLVCLFWIFFEKNIFENYVDTKGTQNWFFSTCARQNHLSDANCVPFECTYFYKAPTSHGDEKYLTWALTYVNFSQNW